MRTVCIFALGVVMVLSLAGELCGKNYYSSFTMDLHALVKGLWLYHQAHHSFPTADICDSKGKPLLSWRVRLLPWFDRRLYGSFHLDESWDSLHNRLLIPKMPSMFQRPMSVRECDAGKTCVVALRGLSTFFGTGADRRSEDLQNDLATTVMLVEGDPEHAPIWTKPEDLPYDPERPTRGLAHTHKGGFFPEFGGFVVLANSDVRFVGKSTDPELLRKVFSIDQTTPINLRLPWYASVEQFPLGNVVAVSLSLSLAFIGGALTVGWRLARGKASWPGEMLCLIIGVQQLAFVLLFMGHYQYNLLPTFNSEPDQQFWLLAAPTAAGALTALTVFILHLATPVSRWYFGALVAVLAVLFLDSLVHDHFWRPEESLMLIGRPFAMAIAALTLAAMSWGGNFPKGQGVGWHWCCLGVALVPLLWFLLGWGLGVVQPQQPFSLRPMD